MIAITNLHEAEKMAGEAVIDTLGGNAPGEGRQANCLKNLARF
jgi:hypothetical protein